MIANISVLGGRRKISDAGRLTEGPYSPERIFRVPDNSEECGLSEIVSGGFL